MNLTTSSSERDMLMRIAGELEGIVITDAEGRYVYVNQRWSSMTGMTINDVRGKYVHDIVRESRVDSVLRMQKFITGDAVLINNRTKEEVPVYCSYTPLFEGTILTGCFIYMIQKSEEAEMSIPMNVRSLLEDLNRQFYHAQVNRDPLENIIGESPKIMKMKHEISIAARSTSTVVIEGETGSGKEVVAQAIHALSNRKNQRMVKVNCAAIPMELLESEFFGYVDGAFTGARRGGQVGKFEVADKGTLFLDEINHMPLTLQPKFLRVLQEREIERVGGTSSIPVDVRIIAATNIPLEKLIEEGKFRSDLYYRLNVMHIYIPPLRERREDIPMLVNHIMTNLNKQLHLQIPGISRYAIDNLMKYDWPGNVRELQNVVERAMNLSWFETLEWKYFQDYFERKAINSVPETQKIVPSSISIGSAPLDKSIAEAEKSAIFYALKCCNGNKTLAAKQLGITRQGLYKKLKQYSDEEQEK